LNQPTKTVQILLSAKLEFRYSLWQIIVASVACVLRTLFIVSLVRLRSKQYDVYTMKNVTIYTTPSCGWCKAAKQYFAEHNVEYSEKDVAADLFARDEMLQKSKQMGVPVIDVGGEIVIGFNQPRLAQLLEIA